MAGLLESLRRAFAPPGTATDAAQARSLPDAQPIDRLGLGPGAGTVTETAERQRLESRLVAEEDDGVYVKPTPITSGATVAIWYAGLLARHGADQVYLHYGFGPGHWQEVYDVPMNHVGWVGGCRLWEAKVRAQSFGTLEFCFHDSADHWDNNNGHNWVYQVHWGARG